VPTIAVAKPYPYEFVKACVALAMIDMQRDFLEPGGFGAALGNDVSQLAVCIEPARRLVEGFRRAGLPIVHTRECHRPDLADCPPAKRARGGGNLRIGDLGPMGRILVAGAPGAEIVAALSPEPGEFVVDKPGKGAFYATPLEGLLRQRGITHLIVGGVTTEVCVQTTMREANDRGFECLLAEDATASYFPHFKQAVLEMVTAQGGIVGWTAPVAAILEAIT
jgi:nicotinamidase-related amidase